MCNCRMAKEAILERIWCLKNESWRGRGALGVARTACRAVLVLILTRLYSPPVAVKL
jgi:hypothetical protein